MFNSKALWLMVCCLLLVACDKPQGDQVPYYNADVKKFKPSKDYPQGHAEVRFGSHHYVIPGAAKVRVDDDGSWVTGLIWPEGEFYNDDIHYRTEGKYLKSGVQTSIDFIEVFIDPGITRTYKKDVAYQKRYRTDFVNSNKWQKSEEYPGFLKLIPTMKEVNNTYIFESPKLLDPLGAPVILLCSNTPQNKVNWDGYTDRYMASTMYEKGLPRLQPKCDSIVYWSDGHRLRIRFKRKHLKDFVQIYQTVIELHDSFLVNSTSVANNKGAQQ